MSKSLSIIQVVMKILRVLAKIAFVVCIIGGVLCIISGSIALASESGADTFFDVTVDGKTVEFIIFEQTGLDMISIAAACFSGAIVCGGAAATSKLQINYLDKEIEDGTPFTFDGAEYLKKTAIRFLIVSIICSIVAAIVFAVMTIGKDTQNIDTGIGWSLSEPLLMLFASVIFKYGAEQSATKNF